MQPLEKAGLATNWVGWVEIEAPTVSRVAELHKEIQSLTWYTVFHEQNWKNELELFVCVLKRP